MLSQRVKTSSIKPQLRSTLPNPSLLRHFLTFPRACDFFSLLLHWLVIWYFKTDLTVLILCIFACLFLLRNELMTMLVFSLPNSLVMGGSSFTHYFQMWVVMLHINEQQLIVVFEPLWHLFILINFYGKYLFWHLLWLQVSINKILSSLPLLF